jgi:two-component system, cell cycle sensor histidine kinase and response regulator CckA
MKINKQLLKIQMWCKTTLIFLLIYAIVPFSNVFATPSLTVLILNSYHKEFKWTDNQVDAAKAVLRKEFKGIDIIVEYMDSKRIYTEPYLQMLHDLYKLKYNNTLFDAIITTDDNALGFVLKYRHELFNDAPIAFCGINDFRDSLIINVPKVSGIIEVLDIKPTIDLALELHPQTEKMVVLVDSTPTGIGQLRDIQQTARQYPNLDFEYIEGKNVTHAQAFEKLRSLPENAVVLLAVWLRDKNNAYLSPPTGGRLISKYSTVPVYGIIDMYFGDGIVGGKLLNSETHGRIAAQKAVLLINEGKTAEVSIERVSKNPYMFDYDQLVRWAINMSDLPGQRVVINSPSSFYSKYKTVVNSVISVLFVLIAILGYLVFNIARRRQVERKLIKSEKKFRTIFQHHSAVKLLIDSKTGNIIEANDAAEKYYGYPSSVLKKKKIQEINLLPKEQVNSEMAQAQIGSRNHFHFKHKLADGSARDVEVFSSAIEIDGRYLLHSIVHDVTERKITEQLLKESERKFRKIFALSPQAIALTDFESGKMTDVNQKVCELTHYQRNELIGRKTTELNLYSPEDRGRFISELKMNGSVNGLEMTFTAKNGEKLIALMYATSINVADQNLILTIFVDITEQKKMEHQLSQAQKMESIGSLAGGIAHDFNNLLFPIVGLSEMMLSDFPPDSPEHHNLHEIFLAGKRGRELVQQILSFSRQSEQQLIPVHIQKVLKEVCNLCRATIPTDIPIARDIQTNCGPVMADPTQIHQIAMNLITNAFHAVEPVGGTISIQLTEVDVTSMDDPAGDLVPGRYAMLSVSDTGIGIDGAVINKIFDPYFTTKEKGRGTGLGLATVYGIVKAHGGDIRVISDIGKGATFHVYLPLLEKTQNAEAEKEMTSLPTGTEHILVVDDEKPIVHLEKQMLERLGYQTSSFTSSRDALYAFKTEPSKFDLVITDMNMPNLNGMQLATELIDIRLDIPIILCTGFSQRIKSEKAEALGIRAMLMKPVGMKDLAQKLREVLDETKE